MPEAEKKNGGWMKVLVIVISIAAIVLAPAGYLIKQNDQIKDGQRELKYEIDILKTRLVLSGAIPPDPRELETPRDWVEFIRDVWGRHGGSDSSATTDTVD